MFYEVWGADLNSLYTETPRDPVLLYVVKGLNEAIRTVEEQMTHTSAAWYIVAKCGKCDHFSTESGCKLGRAECKGVDAWSCDAFSSPFIR